MLSNQRRSPSSSTPIAEFRRSWLIVLVTMIGMCFGGSGVLWYSIGALIDPMRKSFGWSNTDVSRWALFVAIGGIVGLTSVGRLVDRLGVRVVVLASIPLCALAIGSGSLITGDVWTLEVVAFCVGMIAAGVSSLTYSRVINGWFDAARGTALGLMSAGIGVGAFFGPRLIQSVVDRHGLHSGFYTLAILVLIPFPVMALFLRERRGGPDHAVATVETGLSRKEAFTRPVFWLLCGGSILWTLCTGGNFHLLPFLTSGGLTRAEAANYAGLLGLTAIFGRMLTGIVLDRIHAPYVCAVVFVTEAVAFVSLGVIDIHYAYLPIMVIGFAHGAEVDCFTYCTARYFGLKSYGSIFGLLSVMAAIGNGLGPLLFGYVRDLSDSYINSYCMDAGFALGAACLLLLVGRHPFLTFPSPPESKVYRDQTTPSVECVLEQNAKPAPL